MKSLEDLRKEYKSTVAQIRQLLPDWREMQATIERNALTSMNSRLSAQYRFYSPEPLTPQDWIEGAKQALAFAKWIKENRLDELPDDVRF